MIISQVRSWSLCHFRASGVELAIIGIMEVFWKIYRSVMGFSDRFRTSLSVIDISTLSCELYFFDFFPCPFRTLPEFRHFWNQLHRYRFLKREFDRISQARLMFRARSNTVKNLLRPFKSTSKRIFMKIQRHKYCFKISIVRRTLERRFQNAAKNSIVEYIQKVKIESAKWQLALSRETINEIMWKVGYSDLKIFRDIFLKTTALTPVECSSKYNKIHEAAKSIAWHKIDLRLAKENRI